MLKEFSFFLNEVGPPVMTTKLVFAWFTSIRDLYIEKGPTVLKYILGYCDWVSDTESGCHNLFPTERKLHFYCYLQTLTFATCLIYYLCQITTFNCFPIHICKAQDGKVVGLNLIRLFHGKRKFKSWELILRIYSKTKIKPSRNHDSLKQKKPKDTKH